MGEEDEARRLRVLGECQSSIIAATSKKDKEQN